MVGLHKPLARIWVNFKFDMREGKPSVLPQCKVEGLAWWGYIDKPLARIWVSSLTCGSAKQAFCPNVRLKAWHGGARKTFGPNLVVKFDMRERKTSVLPQCKVEGLAWWG